MANPANWLVVISAMLGPHFRGHCRKIIFYNDPNDDNPLPNANSDTTSTNLQVQLFIQGGPAPGKMAAGSRRSLHVPCPSACITDPNNMEALASTTTCKQSGTVTTSTEGSSNHHSAAWNIL